MIQVIKDHNSCMWSFYIMILTSPYFLGHGTLARLKIDKLFEIFFDVTTSILFNDWQYRIVTSFRTVLSLDHTIAITWRFPVAIILLCVGLNSERWHLRWDELLNLWYIELNSIPTEQPCWNTADLNIQRA